MDEQLLKFIALHRDDDTARLLLSADKYPGVDVRLAVSQIESGKKAALKLPEWHSVSDIVYPSSLSLEQCSSQATALFKQRFIHEGDSVADITGGLGVDCYYMSKKASHATYFERSEELCEAAKHNFTLLGAGNISVIHSTTDSATVARRPYFDLIFADPARRGKASQRVYALEDCEPDILALKDVLLEKCDSLLVKISPMADISHTVKLLPESAEIHILSVANECKEVLLLLRKGFMGEPKIVCSDLTAYGDLTSQFSFVPSEEESATASFSSETGKYLYQPGKAVLKGGAFKLVSERFSIAKLAPSTHLYTSDKLSEDFPGKIFEIQKLFDWNKQTIALLRKEVRNAELLSVNFPLDTKALRSRLGIPDGSSTRLVATTLGSRKVILQLAAL